jgi:hypothetical protein
MSRVLSVCLLLTLAVACGPSPAIVATEAEQASTAIAAAWTATPSTTPSPSPTPTPTVTATPTSTPTPAPMVTPSPIPDSISPWDARRMKWSQADLNSQWVDGVPGVYCPAQDLSNLTEDCQNLAGRTEVTVQFLVDADLRNRPSFPVRGFKINPAHPFNKGLQDIANGFAYVVSLLPNSGLGLKRVIVSMDLYGQQTSDGSWWHPVWYNLDQENPYWDSQNTFRDMNPEVPILVIFRERGAYPSGPYGTGVIPGTNQLAIFVTLDEVISQYLIEHPMRLGVEGLIVSPLLEIANLHPRLMAADSTIAAIPTAAKPSARRFSLIVYGRSFLGEDLETDEGPTQFAPILIPVSDWRVRSSDMDNFRRSALPSYCAQQGALTLSRNVSGARVLYRRSTVAQSPAPAGDQLSALWPFSPGTGCSSPSCRNWLMYRL